MKYPEYRYREFCKGSVTNRNNLVELKEITDTLKLTSGREDYQGVYRFTEDILPYREKTLNIKNEHTIAGYNGTRYLDYLVIDIDRENDIPTAYKDTRYILNRLTNEFSVDTDTILTYFSGYKGFNILLPSVLFSLTPGADLPEICLKIALELAGNVKIDNDMFQPNRLHRMNNTRNAKSGLFKIELHTIDLLHGDLELETILDKSHVAQIREPIEHIDFNEYEGILSHLVSKLRPQVNVVTNISTLTPTTTQTTTETLAENKTDKLWVSALNGNVKSGSRTASLISLIGHYADKLPESEILKICQLWDNNNTPTLSQSYGDNKVPDTVRDNLKRYHNGGLTEIPDTPIDLPVGDIADDLPETTQTLFNDYMSLFNGVTEAPDSYHFMGLISALGMILNKRVYTMYSANELYSNSYIALVGKSAYSRKSTAMNCIKKLTRQASNCQVMNSLSSWEGLVFKMTTPEENKDNITHNNTLCMLSELNSLLRKSRNVGVSNIIPGLIELYDTPDNISLNTKSYPLKVNNPFFSILSAIQPGVLAKEMSKEDIDSGFTGRFLYVTGNVKDSLPLTNKVDRDKWNMVSTKLIELSMSLPTNESKEIVLSTDCNEIWTTFYNSHRQLCKDSSENIATLIARIPEYVRKFSMIFAVCNGHTEISYNDMLDSIAIGKWCMKSAMQLFSNFGKQEHEVGAEKILAILKKNGGKMTRRDLMNNSNLCAEIFSHAEYNLISSELIDVSSVGKKKIVSLCQ